MGATQLAKLKTIPQELVVDLVVILHLRSLHERPEEPWTAVSRSLLQVGIAPLDIIPKYLPGPLRRTEIVQCSVDVVRQVSLSLAQIVQLRRVAVQPGFENR